MLEACLRSDALNVSSEEEVVTSLLRWINHDLPERQKLLPGLLSLTRLHHLPTLKVGSQRSCWDLNVMLLLITFDVLRHSLSLRLCRNQTLSLLTASPVSLCSQRRRVDRISTPACSRTPGRPPRRATSTSTRRRRTERSATPSATVWKRIRGKSWEQGKQMGPPRYRTHRDPSSLALLRRCTIQLKI